MVSVKKNFSPEMINGFATNVRSIEIYTKP
jgi:hypothetical protein